MSFDSFSEFLVGRYPRHDELLKAINRFAREPKNASEAIRVLAAHRDLNGLPNSVMHWERAAIQDDWRTYEKQRTLHAID